MKKINLSFLMYGGLTYGGAHRMGMNLAKLIDKNRFEVRYFWCRPAVDKYSSFKHPPINLAFLDDLKSCGVETIEFRVGYRDISQLNHPWFETDFFEVFNSYPTDITFGVRAGQSEFPIMHINKPLIEWNVFGGADHSNNLIYSVAHSPWVKKQYLSRGGDETKSGLCYPGVATSFSHDNFRHDYGIDDKTIVLGFHQRADDSICGEHALKAWKEAETTTSRKLTFFILGGSEKYKKIAKQLGISINFIPVSTDSNFISKFLNTLDIYTHSGKMGETLGMAIEEAMMHKLPVVAMLGKYNGHVDVIGDTLPVAGNVEEYAKLLITIINDDVFRSDVSMRSFERAQKLFSFDSMKQYFENLFITKFQEYCIGNKKNFSTVPIDIYGHLNIRTVAYRFLCRTPRLLNFVLSVRNKILIIFNKFNYVNK